MFRMILTWVVIIPDLIISYHALRNPYINIEVLSLALNFIAATVLFYIYVTINTDNSGAAEGEETPKATEDSTQNDIWLYKLAFGSLIEDMLVWMGLFFLLYNLIPITLFIHNMIGRNI